MDTKQELNSLWDAKMDQIKLGNLKFQGNVVKSLTVNSIYEPVSAEARQKVTRILTANVKSLKISPNSNLCALGLTLLRIIYNDSKDNCYLQIFMKHLNLPSNNFGQISHCPLGKTTNLQSKMSLTLLLKANQICNFQEIEMNLENKPELLDLIVIFLRILLKNCNVKNAEDYQKIVNSQDAFTIITDIFRIQLRVTDNLFFFLQNGMFISTHDQRQYLIGKYFQNQTQMMKEEKLTNSAIEELYNKCSKQTTKKLLLDESRDSSNSEQFMFRRQYIGQPTPTFNVTPTFPKEQIISFENQKSNLQSEQTIYNVVKSRDKVFGIISMIQSVDQGLSKYQHSSVCDSPVEFQLTNQDKQIIPISPTTSKFQQKRFISLSIQPDLYLQKKKQQEKLLALSKSLSKPKSPIKSKVDETSKKEPSYQKNLKNGSDMKRQFLNLPPSPSNSLKAQKTSLYAHSNKSKSKSKKSDHKRFLTKSFNAQFDETIKNSCFCIKMKKKKMGLCSNLYQIEIREKPYSLIVSTPQSMKNATKNFFDSIKFRETQKYSPKVNQETEQQKKKRNQDQFNNIFRKKINEQDKFKSQSQRFLNVDYGAYCLNGEAKASPTSCLNKSKNQSVFNFNEEPYQINKESKFFKREKNSKTDLTKGKDKKTVRCHTTEAKSSKQRKSSLNYTIKKRIPENLFKSEKDDIKMAVQVQPVNCYIK